MAPAITAKTIEAMISLTFPASCASVVEFDHLTEAMARANLFRIFSRQVHQHEREQSSEVILDADLFISYPHPLH